jgi:hypothetical protein
MVRLVIRNDEVETAHPSELAVVRVPQAPLKASIKVVAAPNLFPKLDSVITCTEAVAVNLNQTSNVLLATVPLPQAGAPSAEAAEALNKSPVVTVLVEHKLMPEAAVAHVLLVA